ncbi:MAG: phage major capsid protein [Clostridia bacterium]|nr:phage major capsid protein [Clostridia bacterium]
MKKKLEELKAKLAALKSRIEADDADAIAEGIKLKGEIETTEAAIAEAEKKASLLALIGKKSEKDDDTDTDDKPAKSLGEHFVKSLPETHGKRFQIAAKAYNDPLAVGTIASPQVPRALVTDIDKNIVQEVLPETFLRSLFGAESISGNALTYFVEGAIESNTSGGQSAYGFDVVDEGAAKPQISFADPTPVTVALDKLAAFIKETDEYIDDAPFLASAINGRLLNYLRLREEAYLLTKLKAASITADTTSWANSADAQDIADLIFSKIQAVQSASGFAADAIIMNPKTWEILRLGKLTNGQYIGGGYFADGQGKQLWGVPVYCSTFAAAPVSGSAAGEIFVGAFKACGSVVSKGGVSVEATNTDADDFQKNRMTIRAEERLALAVRRPAGFVKIVKAATDPQ